MTSDVFTNIIPQKTAKEKPTMPIISEKPKAPIVQPTTLNKEVSKEVTI